LLSLCLSTLVRLSVEFDDRAREIDATTTSAATSESATNNPIGAGYFRSPSLAPNVGPTSLGDTASGWFPLMALGRYTDPDDSVAQDRFWIRASKRDRGVDSGSDFSFTEFDSRSALDRYFVEEGIRRGSGATASVDVQVGPSHWTWRHPSPVQGGPHPLSDPSQLPPQFKKPKTPPPRTVVVTTRIEMYMRHTSQDVMVTSPTGHRRSSSSSTSTGSQIPGLPLPSPRSSVQQWLDGDALDTPAPPPLTPVILPSQPVSMYSGVTSSMPLGYSASQMAPQRVRSSCHSQTSRRSRFSTTSATVIQGMMDFSTQMSNNIAHLAEGVRVDAANREEAMRQEAQMSRHESLAREQCHRQQATERERVQREEAVERDKLQKQETLEWERMLREEAAIREEKAALREEKMRADALAREELCV